ncbi:MAG: RICIN domain-containing protein [Eubacteriales bacterium]|nr:RICIN domain-containing protein [Eubacteriales bacterium]
MKEYFSLKLKKVIAVAVVTFIVSGIFNNFESEKVVITVHAESIFNCYSLSEAELRNIAALCQKEQSTAKGAAAEASLMANIYELSGSRRTFYDFVENCGWWSPAKEMDTLPASSQVISAVENVLRNGKRILPGYINEHDYLKEDIASVTNNGVSFDKTDRTQYIPYVTQIHQATIHEVNEKKFGFSTPITYTFYCFPTDISDPFGYTSETIRQQKGEAYYDYETGELVGTPPPTSSGDEELGIPYNRPSGTPVLKNGSRGDNVRWLQSALNKIGYSLTVDGIFGSGTENSVKDFQISRGLEVDGKAGPQTINKLVEEIKNNITPPEPPADDTPKGHEMADSEGAGQTIPDGDYWIKSKIRSNYWVDIPGDEIAAEGTNVHMWIRDEGVLPKQYDVFTFTYLGNGFYKIMQKDSNLCLEVGEASLDRGANVRMWSDNGSACQQWSVICTEKGFRLQSKCNSYFLDVAGSSFEKKTNVQIWEDNGCEAQLFSFIPYGDETGKTIEDGVYRIKSALDKEYCLDAIGLVSRNEYKAGTNIDLWNSEGDDLFKVKYVDNGWYIITEISTGLALDVYDEYPEKYMETNNIQLYNSNDRHSQRWLIRDCEDGTYNIISQMSGYCVDVNGGKCDNGINISQYIYNGTPAQRWIFDSAEPSELEIVSLPDKTKYLVNEKIDTSGLRVLAKYSCGSCMDVSDAVKVKYDFSKTGTSTVSVTYTVNGIAIIDSFDVNVVKTIVPGDCNDDGRFDSTDAIVLQKYLLGSINELENRNEADLNDNGVINIVDLIILKNLLVS